MNSFLVLRSLGESCPVACTITGVVACLVVSIVTETVLARVLGDTVHRRGGCRCEGKSGKHKEQRQPAERQW